jgi:hypothetical protein
VGAGDSVIGEIEVVDSQQPLLTTLMPQSLGTQHVVGMQHSTCAGGAFPPNRPLNRPHPRNRPHPMLSRFACHVYVLQGFMTVTGQPVTGSVDMTGRYEVTGTFVQLVR